MSESYRVCAVFTLKDQHSKDRFITFCNGENGLSVTRAFDGCQSLEMYETHENPNKIVIWQRWESKEKQEGLFGAKVEAFELPVVTRSTNRELKSAIRKSKSTMEVIATVGALIALEHIQNDDNK